MNILRDRQPILPPDHSVNLPMGDLRLASSLPAFFLQNDFHAFGIVVSSLVGN